MTTADVPRARGAARRVLRDLGVEAPAHISVRGAAAILGASIVSSPDVSLRSVSAWLVRVNHRAIIRVAAHQRDVGAQRFSIAHELGHLALGHQESIDVIAGGALRAGGAAHAWSPREVEANAFAAELLMPEALVRRRCEVSPVTLAIPRAIARDFRVSLVAAIRRFVELTSERCALVFASGGLVRWAVRSPTFRPFIRTGWPVGGDTVAHDIERGRGDDLPHEVPASAWLDMSDDRGAELVEHATAVPEASAIASLLWIRERDARAMRSAD